MPRKTYKAYDPADYKTREWFDLKAYVIQREGGRCQYCGCRAETAHHLSYRKGVVCPPELLKAICWRCHNKIPNKYVTKWN